MQAPSEEIKAQWQNPGDIFSLLLLVGADVIQKAVAHLAGVRVKIFSNGPTIYITPAVFSFGWVAYAFTSLAAVAADHRLMPRPDTDIQVVNCENGYTRDNSSWLLARLLRDRESVALEARRLDPPPTGSTGSVSLLIEILVAQKVNDQGPRPSSVWWLSWLLIVAQLVIAAIPWIKWGYWPPFMITICGTLLAISTAAIPQWTAEKWSAAKLKIDKTKPVALTGGNGHQYVMVILSHNGSWDLETMATNRAKTSPSTKYILTVIALLWVLLLLTVTGMKQYTWFLVIVGASGSLWQTYLAVKPSRADHLDITLTPWHERPTITGYQYQYETKKVLKRGLWKSYTDDAAQHEVENKVAEPDVRDVMGALMELEKHIPRAGASLLSIFFPGGIDYEPDSLNFEREKRFWRFVNNQQHQP